jgi:Fe-S-cluster-containing dehydrogenase component/CRP-like cAMP-binding protein
MLRLRVQWRGKTTAEYQFDQREVVLGGIDTCEVCLRGEGVSRFHAVIVGKGTTYDLIDSSVEGTFLNDVEISTHSIREGDRIGIGGFVVEVLEATPIPIERDDKGEWTNFLGDPIEHADVERLLKMEPFCDIDLDAFPKNRRLRAILQTDCRLLRCSDGDIVLREGDYGTTAYFVVSGATRYVLDSLPDEVLGRKSQSRKSLSALFSQIRVNRRIPELRSSSEESSSRVLGRRDAKGKLPRVFLQDVPHVLDEFNTAVLTEGEIFGEISALGRTPRAATVFAEGEVTLLEIRWQGLRDLRRYSPRLRQYIDKNYRERSLRVHIRETSLLESLTDEEIDEVVSATVFETYGEFDWYGSYNQRASEEGSSRTIEEPVIFREGDYVNGMVLIRSGFARLSESTGGGERTISYLGRGDTYGFEEIAHSWRSDTTIPYQRTLRAIGYTDVLVVPTQILEDLVITRMQPSQLPKMFPDTSRRERLSFNETQEDGVDPALLEFLVEHRFNNGTSIMMIDLDRCVRCDDCVTACATVHGGNPRFVRHGKQFRNYMIANSCMHCSDPVCMLGCPTGAIHRDPEGGQIVINENTCVGCSVCADSCPYDNIRMVSTRNEESLFHVDPVTQQPVIKATKCDLCVDQWGGPACERSCPHDALKRVDLSDFATLRKWVKKS